MVRSCAPRVACNNAGTHWPIFMRILRLVNAQFGLDFRKLNSDRGPYPYQEKVAAALWGRRNVILCAPTGSGKTLAVLAPFLLGRHRIGARRLIYALPLRTLAQGIYQTARDLAPATWTVTLQTGEQPDDPFFTRGDIIVTTYDQVLSGMLCGPYGQSPRLHNINAAAVAGNLVVFDEFHLMEPSKAFLTGIACLSLFLDMTRSAWMTATATSPLTGELQKALQPEYIMLGPDEMEALPSVGTVRRELVKEPGELTAEAVLRYPGARSLVVLNSVVRAQKLYETVVRSAADLPVQLMHGRFFRNDRESKQKFAQDHFGRENRGPAMLIATQVIEAGLDLTCDHLHAEICPMNALVQRAGRCARFENQEGLVHVYDAPNPLPYSKEDVDATRRLLPTDRVLLTPTVTEEWVEEAHRASDEKALLEGWAGRRIRCSDTIRQRVQGMEQAGVAELIRSGSDTVRLAVRNDPRGVRPGVIQTIQVYRNQLRSAWENAGKLGWTYAPDSDSYWEPLVEIEHAFLVAVPSSMARYTAEIGLVLGQAGEMESPPRQAPPRPGYAPLRREAWTDHAKAVEREAHRRLEQEAFVGSLLATAGMALEALVRWSAILHDLGKLQASWQDWAERYEKARDASYVHTALLAHTDYDSNSAEDRALEKSVQPRRPPHSAASAWYGFHLLPEWTIVEKAAVLSAVLSHHGGWSLDNIGILDPRWSLAWGTEVPRLNPPTPRERDGLARGIMPADSRFFRWWPVASYLMRTLRLSDRRATEDNTNG
jgi:CRISPR-associated endonuclease/helicase Cas3